MKRVVFAQYQDMNNDDRKSVFEAWLKQKGMKGYASYCSTYPKSFLIYTKKPLFSLLSITPEEQKEYETQIMVFEDSDCRSGLRKYLAFLGELLTKPFELQLEKELIDFISYTKSIKQEKPIKEKTQSQVHFLIDRTSEIEKKLSHILSHVSYHIHPDIVKRIVEANNDFKSVFSKSCHGKLDVNDYFYKGSDCVFPGFRRPVNKEKQKTKRNNNINHSDGTIFNDNTFPRHLWSYLCAGKGYNSQSWKTSKLNSFETAHIFAHKLDEKKLELKAFKNHDPNVNPYSLFSSASNTALIPKGLTKPTDNSETIKLIFFKRYFDLYGGIVELPGMSGFNDLLVSKWYNDLKWMDPIRPVNWEKNLNSLLKYRENYLIKKYQKMS